MSALWEPLTVGRMRLPHRLALAPMTRSRALPDGTPGPLAAEYYAQRASLGLLITEGVQPSDDGQGYLNTPGISRPAHVDGWRTIADAVHDRGGHLVLQLMHVGRMSHPDNTPHHRQPLAPSAIAAGVEMFTPSGRRPAPRPRAMTSDDIRRTVAEFRDAAGKAVEAGADGVEIHAANGYLLHQFLSPNANLRTDGYGGSIPARSRFAIEVAAAVADEIGGDRVGIRISPGLLIGGIDEGPDAADQYRHLVGELAPLGLAYLHVVQSSDEALLRDLRALWPGALLVLRAGRSLESVADDVDAGVADVAPVARWALANPDLVDRIRAGAPLNDADPVTFYGGGAAGYTDYPALASIST
ncbi:alkene reductase [Microbacterium sp. ZW CA_36]|uniref:alkene reductase n=1 Tax=Microbacterium sp. ZW CA_36 TaxID=3378078 RepID=UPI0038542ED2